MSKVQKKTEQPKHEIDVKGFFVKGKKEVDLNRAVLRMENLIYTVKRFDITSLAIIPEMERIVGPLLNPTRTFAVTDTDSGEIFFLDRKYLKRLQEIINVTPSNVIVL
jgi:hypothetical protein